MRKHPNLEERFAGYADAVGETRHVERRKARLLAGALLTAGAACAGLPAAEAAVVYTDVNPDVTVNAANPAFYVNIAGATRFGIGTSHWASGTYSIYSVFVFRQGTATDRRMARGANDYAAKRFASGVTIGAAESWRSNWQMLVSSWGYTNTGPKGGHAGRGDRYGAFSGQDGYIGIRFPTGAGTDPKYGWIRFQGSVDNPWPRPIAVSGVVKGFAYRDDGTAIFAGEAQ